MNLKQWIITKLLPVTLMTYSNIKDCVPAYNRQGMFLPCQKILHNHCKSHSSPPKSGVHRDIYAAYSFHCDQL